MGRCPTPRKGEAGLRPAPVVAKPTSTGRRATLTCLKTRFARFSVQGRIVRLQYQYAEKPHESYIMRLNLCVKAASYYKQTLAMEDYNNGL